MMTDEDINEMLSVDKLITKADKKIKFKHDGIIKEHDIVLKVAREEIFTLKLRVNTVSPDDFSAIISVKPKNGHEFNLMRCNGCHFHKNKLEKNRFFGFHVHKATARYIEAGHKAEGFAETTGNYSTLDGAFETLSELCNIRYEDDNCRRLF